MNGTNPGHPPAEQLRALVLGHLSDLEAAAIGPHVWDCAACLQGLEQFPDDADPFLSRLRAVYRDRLPLGGPAATPPEGPGGAPPPLSRHAAGDTSAGSRSQETDLEIWPFLAPPESPNELGRLAQYRVLRVLGQGGMGVVFQAVDVTLRRPVALKVLRPHLAQDSSARRRFLREARAMAVIRHDHVVAIHQVGEDRGVPFLAMELLRGEPLDRWLERSGRPAVAQVLRLGRAVAGGLAAAHARGLVHRDVKPANIFLEWEDDGKVTEETEPGGSSSPALLPPPFRVKLLDFGLACNSNDDVHLTASGVVVGTPAYMSPEQARGQPVDARSDLFSLGCVLYRLCTGRAPFEAPTAMAVLTALAIDTPAPIRRVNPEVPPALADLVARLLAKPAADRPPSAEAVAEALQAILDDDGLANRQGDEVPGAATDGPPSSPRLPAPAPPQRTRLLAWVAAAVLLVGSTAVLTLLAFRNAPTRQDESVVSTDDPDLTFQVTDDGVTLRDRTTGRVADLSVLDRDAAAGEYLVEITGPDTRPELRGRTFTVRPGRPVGVQARLQMQPDPTRPPPPAVAPFPAEQAGQLQHGWGDHLRRRVVERNSLGMKLVLIPPGEFSMGARDDEGGRPWEQPCHTVRLTRSYYLGAHEVTVGQFRAFVAATGYRTEAEASGTGALAYQEAAGGYAFDPTRHWRNPGFGQDDDHPVCCLTWNDAVKFCEWLSRKEGRTYRLPREAEWEYACRAGTVTPFHTGAKLTAEQARVGAQGTERVGSYPANAFGLCDVHGNVAEWCRDGCRLYGPGPQTDPDGGTRALGTDKADSHALRGGNWINLPRFCRSATRNAAEPTAVSNEYGFRVLCVPESGSP